MQFNPTELNDIALLLMRVKDIQGTEVTTVYNLFTKIQGMLKQNPVPAQAEAAPVNRATRRTKK